MTTVTRLVFACAVFAFLGVQASSSQEPEPKPKWVLPKGHTDKVTALAFSQDGKRLASGSFWDRTVRLWDLETGKEIRILGQPKSAFGFRLKFTPDGKEVVTLHGNSQLTFWPIDEGKASTVLKAPGPGTLVSCDVTALKSWDYPLFSPDGKYAAVQAPNTGKGKPQAKGAATAGRFLVWDVAKREQVSDAESTAWIPAAATRIPREVLKAVETGWGGDAPVSLDGKLVLMGTTVYDIGTRTVFAKFPRNNLTASVLNRDATMLAAGDGNGDIVIWELPKRNKERLVKPGEPWHVLEGHTTSVLSLAFSPDSKLLASSSATPEKTIRLWDVTNGKPLRVLYKEKGNLGATGVNFSPDGKFVGTFSQTESNLFPVAENQPAIPLLPRQRTLEVEVDTKAHPLQNYPLFSPDGKYVACLVAPMPGEVKKSPNGVFFAVYETATGKHQAQEGEHAAWILAVRNGIPENTVDKLRVSTNTGKKLAVSRDKSLGAMPQVKVMVWDLDTYSVRATFPHAHSAALNPEGTLLAAGELKGVIRIWDVPARTRR